MTDFTLPAHVCKLWLVRVTDTAGQVLPPGGFDFYGCASAPGGRAVAMVAEVRGDATELVLPGLCAPGAWELSIFCREVATGVTWQVAAGRVNVTPAPVLHGVAPAMDELVAVLDPVMQELRVVLGDSSASAAENARLAVAARAGADEAAARVAEAEARVGASEAVVLDVAAGAALAAERAEDSKRGAEAAAGDADADARVAEAKAAEAEAAQRQAAARAAEADASAKVAADAANDALAARDEAVAAQRGAEAAQVVAEDASAQAGRYAEQAVGASDGAVVAQGKAEAAQSKAEQEAIKAEQNAALLGDAALKGADNVFTGINEHGGTEFFNGAVALNGAVAFPGGTTTAAEMAAGYFYARRYWELAADIAGLFKEQTIDALPKDNDGLVKLSFPKATKGADAFAKCRCSGAAISMAAVSTQANLTSILCGLNNNNLNSPYGFGVFKLSLPLLDSVNLDYPLRLWAEKVIIDAPKAKIFKSDARKRAVYGNLPVVEEVRCDNSAYAHSGHIAYRWFVPLSVLKNGYFGESSISGDKYRLSADSVLCILGTIPVWEDGEAHVLHLNIHPNLQNDTAFQEKLAAALGAQNEDGTFKGALVREYGENGTSGEDELGLFTDSYVADKGWRITVTYA